MKTLATYNIKGGVGKTSSAVNFAVLAAQQGRRTLLWDLDPQGAASYIFRVKARVRGGGRKLVTGRSEIDGLIKGTDHENLDLLPADFSYRHMDLVLDDSKQSTQRLSMVLDPLKRHYDLAVLDCPPSISLVSENVFRAADALLVPLIPTTLSLRTLEQLERFVRKHRIRRLQIIPFFSMVDRRKVLHRRVLDELWAERSDVLHTVIPSLSEVEQMGVHRDAVVSFAPESRAARVYTELWAEVAERI